MKIAQKILLVLGLFCMIFVALFLAVIRLNKQPATLTNLSIPENQILYVQSHFDSEIYALDPKTKTSTLLFSDKGQRLVMSEGVAKISPTQFVYTTISGKGAVVDLKTKTVIEEPTLENIRYVSANHNGELLAYTTGTYKPIATNESITDIRLKNMKTNKVNQLIDLFTVPEHKHALLEDLTLSPNGKC